MLLPIVTILCKVFMNWDVGQRGGLDWVFLMKTYWSFIELRADKARLPAGQSAVGDSVRQSSLLLRFLFVNKHT